ncbi:protein odr-4 homolog [Teleopsis dalmanni]|uniref:protein odr-4 homolog n=1 Tax=Teleopsis dalmanni TaxID=139649 RepID=UPI0018CE6F6A|nr:protein odr-4 homolog [Teleopsis dalmanni]
MPILLLSKSDEIYLQKCGQDLDFAFGIVAGQHAEPEKFVVVHLAKNCDEDEVAMQDGGTEQESQNAPKCIDDIDVSVLSHQWTMAEKMLPGSFRVLGGFVSTKSEINENLFKSAKRILNEIQNILLKAQNYISFVDDVNKNLLFLAYSTTTNKAMCRFYTHSNNGGTLSPMDCRIVEKPFEWYEFETNYDVEGIYNIVDVDATTKINIEDQFKKLIEETKNELSKSTILFDNDCLLSEELLENYVKKKKENDNISSVKCFYPKIYVFNEIPSVMLNIKTEFKVFGSISSRIWCNPKTSIGDVKRFICEDIMRSLAARIQVYCDGLTDPNVSTDSDFMGEPPRRIYFKLTTTTNDTPVQFSEYIFRGEAPLVAVAQAKQYLDMEISEENICKDLERVADEDRLNQSTPDSSYSIANNTEIEKTETKRSVYFWAFLIAFGVLMLSVLLAIYLGK